jgi:hypothetical protein
MDREKEEKQTALALADGRLTSIYEDFDQASIKYNKQFFDKAA